MPTPQHTLNWLSILGQNESYYQKNLRHKQTTIAIAVGQFV